MTSESRLVRRRLRQAGVTARAIDAAWPEWWSSDAESSVSATTELRYTLARRLGLLPTSLFDGEPKFLWRDEAKFKRRRTESNDQVAALTSFGVAIAQLLVAATQPSGFPLRRLSAAEIRAQSLTEATSVTLSELVVLSWGLGIPIVQLRVFPLDAKRMHAVTVNCHGRFAILIGQETQFQAQAAYTVAHELGHIVLGHLESASSLLELTDPARSSSSDEEEAAADAFALEVLTGQRELRVEASVENFTAAQLRDAAIDASRGERIDPGVLALCLGHATGRWRQTIGALKGIPPGPIDIPAYLNGIAESQLDVSQLSFDQQHYVREILGLP